MAGDPLDPKQLQALLDMFGLEVRKKANVRYGTAGVAPEYVLARALGWEPPDGYGRGPIMIAREDIETVAEMETSMFSHAERLLQIVGVRRYYIRKGCVAITMERMD